MPSSRARAASLPRLAAAALLGAALWFGSPAAADELLVSAAASLTNAVGAAAEAFRANNPAAEVTCNFAGSGILLRQLELGAPVDLLLAADRVTMDLAEQRGLTRPETRQTFACNTLVLIATPGLAQGGFTLRQLGLRKNLLLAVGNPKFVPAGRYAREALGRNGLWDSLQGRLLLGNSVRQVLDYVSRGEVDVGVVYATDAALHGDRVRVVKALPTNHPIEYSAAVTTTSARPRLADRFIRFLLAPEGREILGHYGFAAAPGDLAVSLTNQ